MSQAQKQAQQAALRSAETYQRYLVPAMFGPWAQVLLTRAGVQAGEQVLDVACGTGVVARHAAELVGQEGRVAALDLNPAMLAVARTVPVAPGAEIDWQGGSAQALPFPDGAFDVVCCQQGLQFFPSPALALREMRRVLVPGGRVAVLVSRAIEHNPLYHRLNEAARQRLGVPAYAAPFALGEADRLRLLLTGAGFQRVEVWPEALQVRFPFPERFVALSLQGAAAALPAWAALDEAARAELAEQLQADVADWLDTHTAGGELTDTMSVLLALGWR
ncbi:hypothetical protein DEIPH_ctg025orf0185 [Deinococcus phoenicis]|uniref:Methyltransferase type 11 n=1 Tax=Deinococcus phoenicis TaxID=1476583 RepID=A0A016QQ90_9DEIO|nr:class I SAM-dependent methyltransferase [Deinococcus phoenicis]EYB68315.1 hypothetical protein DEIPH_ctg025orf0185 [Deinococcus phoenicis]